MRKRCVIRLYRVTRKRDDLAEMERGELEGKKRVVTECCVRSGILSQCDNMRVEAGLSRRVFELQVTIRSTAISIA